MNLQVPHPIPYQGSKRKLSPEIASFITSQVNSLYEPFVGSGAFTLYAARYNLAQRFVIGDALEPLIELWKLMVLEPQKAVHQYNLIWRGQKEDKSYYNKIRESYNQCQDPVMLLYLIARCVKNAVRFNHKGDFTQAADKRRLGTHPDKMAKTVYEVSNLLRGKIEFYAGDFEECLAAAHKDDLVYLDPPYQGTTNGKDRRYYKQLDVNRLCHVLRGLNERDVPFILSYDGMHGDKEYGVALPDDLNVHKILIDAGRSSQATLNGKNIITREALYVTHSVSQNSMRQPIIQRQQMRLGI